MIQKVKVYEGSAQDHYEVTLLNGEWPSDKELIDFCDPDNFGGHVEERGDKKKVFGYTD